MEEKLKTLKSARREYIAHSVAMSWLRNAEKVIARGGSPMKFSTIVRVQINEELSRLDEQFILPSSAGITRMANKSVAFALYLLRNGRFPTVAKHFSRPLEKHLAEAATLGEEYAKSVADFKKNQ